MDSRIQTQLVKTLNREVLAHRRALRNTLASQVTNDVRKYRVMDEHYASKKQALIHAVESVKLAMDTKESYYIHRGFLALDMAYTKVLHTLGEFERAWSDEVTDLQRQDTRMVADAKLMASKIKSRQNEFLFFKSL